MTYLAQKVGLEYRICQQFVHNVISDALEVSFSDIKTYLFLYLPKKSTTELANSRLLIRDVYDNIQC
jgi:hypothetical protein